MFSAKDFKRKILSLQKSDFDELALELFHYQYEKNPVYQDYVNAIGRLPQKIKQLTDIPFLPIQFFKTHRVADGDWEPDRVFESSGTTQMVNSRHYVKDADWYKQCCLLDFHGFYGNINQYAVLGLLPSYLERNNSSLVFMVKEWMHQSGHPANGFYLQDHEKLFRQLCELEQKKQNTILIGVTFALLDFAINYPMKMEHTIVMETGGMKGRKEEMTRQEVHEILKQSWQLQQVHSEYGMTELLSQAYAKQQGIFQCPPWMTVMVRDEYDPLQNKKQGTGVINIIDLANIHSCAFIATEDIGKVYATGDFEVMGRLDGSALRGCSLMVS